MRSYVIERDDDSWVLRIFGGQDALISGPTVESAKEQAFEYARDWAPCRVRVMADEFEEWMLDDTEGKWWRV